MWAENRFAQLIISVRGIQHFSKQPSKNAADITLAIDAATDFASGATQFVAVMSDDSDFMALYAKLKELNQGEIPFLWVMTDRDKTRSATIRDYFPNDHIHVLRFPAKASRTKTPSASPTPKTKASKTKDPAEPPKPKTKGSGKDSERLAKMAELIIEKMPIGVFRSTQCQTIIEEGWPKDPMVKMPGPSFGTEFAKKLWPMLEQRGAKLKKEKPRKYEMTEEAKRRLKSGKAGKSA